MDESISLMLVEDQTVVREGLRRLLEMQPGLKVVGEASSVLRAVDLHAKLQPDVIIMDLKLGQESGIDACHEILVRKPGARILVLSAYDDFPMIERAIAVGVLGYAPKLASFQELLDAIGAVTMGHRYIHPVVADRLMEGMRNSVFERASKLKPLSEREIQLLRCVSEGMSYREIAASLFSSERSVRRHIQLICEKLDVTDRVQAVSVALRNSWL